MKIEIVYATPDLQKLITLEVQQGMTARQASIASALDEYFPELDLTTVPLGVFGASVTEHYELLEGDRVELYRQLIIDPMEARRRRAIS